MVGYRKKLAERPIVCNRVDVDLIGPLSVKTPSGKKELLALTMIDPSTGRFEVVLIMEENKKMYLKSY
jgi:hypothetical protein